MLRSVLVVLTVCCCGYGAFASERFNFRSQVGIVDANDERRWCLNISNGNLLDGTSVSFILPHKPQRVVHAVIDGKAGNSCSRDPMVQAETSFYWLKLVNKPKAIDLSEVWSPAIAIVSPARPLSIRRGIASGDLDGDGRPEFFRICASSEGNHLTIWSGKPLIGKRRWHSYYYLGYDTVANCKKKDYQ